MTIEVFSREMRWAARRWARTPGVSLLLLSSVAVGICVNASVFTAIDAVAFRQVPYPDPKRLMAVVNTESGCSDCYSRVDLSEFELWQAHARAFASLAAFRFGSAIVGRPGSAMTVDVGEVSPRFFATLGAVPSAGRVDWGEVKELQPVILGHSFWVREYGARPDIIGQTVEVDETPRVIVGVLGSSFHYPGASEPEIFVPLSPPINDTELKTFQVQVVGRLVPSVSPMAADVELRVLSQGGQNLGKGREEGGGTRGMRVVGLRTVLGQVAPTVLLWFQLAAITLLAIVCLNLSCIVLAKSFAGHRDIAVLLALGASPFDLILRAAAEASLLASIIGLSGGALGVVGAQVSRSLFADWLPPWASPGLDLRMVLAVACVSLLAAVLITAAPALNATRIKLRSVLDQGTGRALGRREGGLLFRFVFFQMSASTVLLLAVGLLAQSVYRATRRDIGYDWHHLLSADVTLLDASRSDSSQMSILYERLAGDLRRLPGIVGVETERPLILSFPGIANTEMLVDDRVLPVPMKVQFGAGISPGGFLATGTSMLQGREFTETENRLRELVVIVNEAVRERWWPHQSPVGHTITLQVLRGAAREYRVVGVVRNLGSPVDDIPGQPRLYFPYNLTPSLGTLRLYVRTSGDPAGSEGIVKRAILQSGAGRLSVETMSQEFYFGVVLKPRRFMATATGLLGLACLLLAGIGVFALLSYSVARRQTEIGIRMALGGSPRSAIVSVLRSALTLTGASQVAGIVVFLVGFMVFRTIDASIGAIGHLSVGAVLAVSAGVTLVALLGSALPAWRAARVDPSRALRGDL